MGSEGVFFLNRSPFLQAMEQIVQRIAIPGAVIQLAPDLSDQPGAAQVSDGIVLHYILLPLLHISTPRTRGDRSLAGDSDVVYMFAMSTPLPNAKVFFPYRLVRERAQRPNPPQHRWALWVRIMRFSSDSEILSTPAWPRPTRCG
jgi:hypothetical protein